MVGLAPKEGDLNTPLGTFSVEQPVYLWLALSLIPIVLLPLWTRRSQSGFRTWFSTALRVALVACMVLGLAGFTRQVSVDALGVVFVVDRSASVGEQGRRQAAEFISAALEHKENDDMAGVVVFGNEALVDVSPTRDLSFHQVTSRPSPHLTDIAAGLRLGTAVMPADRTRRIILLSDGEQTRGKADSQILLTAGSDLSVATVHIGGTQGPDALLEDLVVPARLDEGSAFRVRVIARSAKPGVGTLRLYRNDKYMGERKITLSGDKADVVSVSQSADRPGLYRYRATLEMDDKVLDTIPQNNTVVGTVQVTGQAKVLYVEGVSGQSKHLARVFREQNIQVDIIPPDQFPSTLGELRPYAAVVLSDVPAYQLTQRQMGTIETYVRDLGRGFMMLGGQHSFGVGGYFKTPIENTLPVNMDIEDKTRFPKIGIVMALDKSCSMGGGAGSKLGLAKEAAILSTELLQEQDLLGVVGFDSAASWILPLSPLNDARRARNTIASIRVGGGTDIYPALSKSINALKASDASLKHVILLSDGVTAPAAFEDLIKDARRNDITITSLTFGTDADRQTMQRFAKWGGGKYYLVTDPKSVPAIFTREIMLASRSFLIEEPFTPVKKTPSELVKGVDIGKIPTLYGYVATEPKQRAVVSLEIPDEEYTSPLLAHWRYGLGRSVAFTSDAKARWARDWVGTETYTQLWTQVTRWIVGETMGQSLDVTTEIQNGEMLIAVDAYDQKGDFRNFLDGSARVVAPDLSVHQVALRQVGPGRYEGVLPVNQDGSWLAGIAMKQGEKLIGQTVAEAVQPYSPEYKVQTMGLPRLTQLGRLGGGGSLTDPAEVFSRPQEARLIPQPLWQHCLWLAAVWLLLDVASRRLEWGSGPRAPKELVGSAASRKAPRRTKKRASSAVPPEMAFMKEPPEAEEEDDDDPPPPPPSASDNNAYAGRLLAARGRATKRFKEEES